MFSIFLFYLKSREGPTGLLEWEGPLIFNTTSHEVTKVSHQIFWGHSMPELNLVDKWQSLCFPLVKESGSVTMVSRPT